MGSNSSRATSSLLRFAHELRIAEMQHFATLTGRSELALWRRLRKLRERRYLACAARFMQRHVYTVGPQLGRS